MEVTNVMKNGQCVINHPFGECCSTQLNLILNEK